MSEIDWANVPTKSLVAMTSPEAYERSRWMLTESGWNIRSSNRALLEAHVASAPKPPAAKAPTADVTFRTHSVKVNKAEGKITAAKASKVSSKATKADLLAEIERLTVLATAGSSPAPKGKPRQVIDGVDFTALRNEAKAYRSAMWDGGNGVSVSWAEAYAHFGVASSAAVEAMTPAERTALLATRKAA